jgi:hypothetical protein
MTAEASSTQLFTLCLFSALSNQFIDQRHSCWNQSANKLLSSLASFFARVDPDLAVPQRQDHPRSSAKAQSLAVCGGDDNPAPIADRCGNHMLVCHFF